MQLQSILLCVFLFISSPVFANNFDLTSSNPLPTTQIILSTPQITIASSHSGQVNINTADLSSLMSLPGIGKVKAQAIIDYRSQNGIFTSCDDLDNVKGIGKKTVEKIKNKCSIK